MYTQLRFFMAKNFSQEKDFMVVVLCYSFVRLVFKMWKKPETISRDSRSNKKCGNEEMRARDEASSKGLQFDRKQLRTTSTLCRYET